MPPPAAQRDPQRQNDETNIERDALCLEVHRVVAELLPPWNIAGRVNLRDAREPRPHTVPRLEAGNGIEAYRDARAGDLDFLRHEGARANEAHLALQDVPQLR